MNEHAIKNEQKEKYSIVQKGLRVKTKQVNVDYLRSNASSCLDHHLQSNYSKNRFQLSYKLVQTIENWIKKT